MTVNDTDVIPTVPPSGYAIHEALSALDHIDVVEQEIDAIAGVSERSRQGLIADRHREIGSTFKRAEIFATLAVADAIADLTAHLSRATIPAESGGPRRPWPGVVEGCFVPGTGAES